MNGFDTIVIVVLLAVAVQGGCPSISYVDSYPTPVYPAPPSVTLSAALQPAVTGSNPLTVNHWSETANLAAYRPPIVYSPLYNSSSCPHLQGGLKNWHDPSTWGSSVPANGTDITLPANTAVLVASCSIEPTFIFGTITVPIGSKLVFGDANINIAAKGFIVQGAILAGTESCRLNNKVVITLVGSRGAQSFPAPANVKGVHVTGSIDLHGAKYSPTWTRLAMTAKQNDTYIFVQDVVNWQPGQRVVITTTELKDARDFNRNEERSIVSVQKTTLGGTTTNVTAIQLDLPLSFRHFGGREYQAEVALLSRNVVVQGDGNSLPTDTANISCTNTANVNDKSTFPCQNSYLSGFGGHIIIDGSGGTKPQGRFSGMELFRVGQTNVLGRYPVHYHMLGDVTNSTYKNHFVQDSAVHDSYFRCYAIHGTQGVKLSENTAYNAIGHCYFLEDGVEENNTITFNQAAHVHPLGPYQNPSIAANGDSFYSQYLSWYGNNSQLILPSDMSAGCFYITNPYNDFVGNAASGGWAGFAMPSLSYPVKLHYGQNNFSPKNRPFRTPFRGNSAHSSGYWWMTAGGIYVGGELQQVDSGGALLYTSGRSETHDTCTNKLVGLPGQTEGCWTLSEQLWLRFEDNKVFLASRGMQHWGERSEIVRLELHDVSLSMNVFGKVWIDNMLMECRTQNNRPTWFNGCPAAPTEGVVPSYGVCNIRDFTFFQSFGGFQWYDVGQEHILTNSTFRNCMATWPSCVYGPSAKVCGNIAVFTSLTHSDQFVPELMQVTHGITYQNVTDKWRYSTKLTDATGYTVSGRLQGWYDSDGSASMVGVRAMIGSTRAQEWWKYNANCTIESEAYKCPLAIKDSAASLILKHNATWEAQIGNTICANGGGTLKCPVVGKVVHFGRNETLGLDIGVNAKVTGPIIGSAGGWFIRFSAGTPKTLGMQAVQVEKAVVLLIAIPYPAGTTFSIYYKAADWCSTSWGICRHNYTSVASIALVKSAFGDSYFWDNSARLLYIRAVTALSYFGGLGGDTPKWSPFQAEEVFSRGGETLFRGSQSTIVIEASCATNPCAYQNVPVPAALSL